VVIIALFPSEVFSYYPMPNNTQKRYIHEKIHNAITFIENNLATKLNLEVVADETHTSPFHFHRLFKLVTQESLNEYITRRRVESAGTMIQYSPHLSMSEVAFSLGFNSLSDFSRVFQKKYGLSPTEFKSNMGDGHLSKICQTDSKNGKTTVSFDQYFRSIENLLIWMKEKTKTIKVETVQEEAVLCTRHQGNFGEIGNAYEKLLNWAGPKGLLNFPKTKMISLYLTSPKITEEQKLISYAGLTLNDDVAVENPYEVKKITSGKRLVGEFEIPKEDFEKAWDSMLAYVQEKDLTVEPSSLFYEMYHNDGTQHPEKLFHVSMFIPLQ